MSKTIRQSTRVLWADILKFWGIFAIVWGHTLSDGAVRQYLYSFHVPLFFFVLGLYFKPSQMSFGWFCRKKAISLLVPYFAFAVISVLIFAVLGEVASSALGADASDFSLSTNLLEIFIGQCRANRPLWFLPCMFLFYILCFWLVRFAEKQSETIRLAAFIIAIVVSVALCLFNSAFLKLESLFWKVDVAVFMLCFFAIAILSKPLLKHRTIFTDLLLTTLFLLIGGILAFHNSTINYISNNYGNVWIFYGSALFTILGLCYFSVVLMGLNVQVIYKTLTYVGQRTLPILLMHKFPILFFQVLFPWTKQPLKDNNACVGFVVAIVSIAGCLMVETMWKKICGALMLKISKNKQTTK